jgi:hypothetical protein
MQIFLKNLQGKTITLEVELTYTIADIREMIPYGNSDLAKIIFCGKELESHQTLAEYGIQSESTLYQVVRLRGGMFHQSSGRNGSDAVLSSRY